MSRNRAFGAVLFTLAVLIMLTPRYILPTCEYVSDGHGAASCSYLGDAEMMTGFIALGAALGAFFSRTKDALRWLMLPALFAAIAVLALPHVTGYCSSPRMACNYGTVPLLRLLGGTTFIIAGAGFFLSREKAY